MSSVVRTPPPTINGIKHTSACADHVEQDAAIFVACGDVQETQFVRAGSVIHDGAVDRIASVAQIDEVDALDDAAVLDVDTVAPAMRVTRRRPARPLPS